MTTPQHAEYNADHFTRGLNGEFMDPVDTLVSKYAGPEGKFESPDRLIAKFADAIGDLLPIKEGMHVLDFGAGTGLFARRIAQKAGISGKVYLAELSPGFCAYLQDQILKLTEEVEAKSAESWKTICEVVQSTEHGVPSVADGTVDLVLVCDVYHHIEYPQDVLADLKRVLKPQEGRLLLIDFYRDSNICKSFQLGFIEAHVRANKDVFQKEVEDSGFTLVEELRVKGLNDNYFLLFEINT
eukprot:TRINITY_DN2307_c0_g1_i1.p1 TRINITY_DN2307_c0_g1~~TRINITY_DN2307_c0_g1_i1.p1  ORF type:complete len:258 (-),score=52.83 TRINITY_DN2307_c0_g1_i1:32-754(-)